MAARGSRPAHEQFRLTSVPVDRQWVRKHNENLSEIRRLQSSAAILGLLCLGGSVAMVLLSGQAAWAWITAAPLTLFALGCAAMVVYIPRRMGSLDHSYAASELVPAVIVDVRPRGLTLLALVDRAIDRRLGSLPALVTRSCEKLPGHELKVGERVPCVAVVGNRSARGGDNTYHFVSPMPIAWATSEAAVLRRCEQEIPASEWETLRRNRSRAEEMMRSTSNVLPL